MQTSWLKLIGSAVVGLLSELIVFTKAICKITSLDSIPRGLPARITEIEECHEIQWASTRESKNGR